MARNKSEGGMLLTIAVIAVIVSAIGFFVVWGAVFSVNNVMFGPNETFGFANVSIIQSIAINFSYNTIDWGSGNLIPASPFAVLDSEGTSTNWNSIAPGISGVFPVNNGLVLANIGNSNATLYLKTGKNATTFIGGTTGGGPSYRYKVRNCFGIDCLFGAGSGDDSYNACGGTVVPTFGSYTDVNATASVLGTKICNQFNSVSGPTGGNELRIDLNITIPSNAPPVAKGDVITAVAEIAGA